MNRINSEMNGGHLTIRIQGSFDLHIFDEFHAAYPEKMAGVSKVTVDLSATNNVDSSALGMLISLWKLLNEDKNRLSVRGANADIMELLEIGQIGQLMIIE